MMTMMMMMMIEIVLDCVAERKTSNDLASSIKDGRYKDQKYRILQSHLRNKVYIIEGISMVDNPKCTAVRTAVADTSVAHDMRILRTRNIDHTIQLLCSIYNQTVVRFQNGKCFYKKKTLPVSNFPFLNQTKISSLCDNGLYISYDDFKQLTVKKTAVTVANLFGEILHEIYITLL
jgi:crossover junction endonuclease MUS81